MELNEIEMPEAPKDSSKIFSFDIHPLKRLELMDDGEFEEIVLEWAYFYLRDEYVSVKRFGGAGDMGRDIVGYYSDKNIDIYQCKHYKDKLSPSEFWIEFGKICYYTYKGEYKIPKNYYIVTTKGIGPALAALIEKPDNIAGKLIENWDNYCRTKITKEEVVELTEEFEAYIKQFDFSIVKELETIKFLDQYSKTKWYKYRFGGGLPKRKLLGEIDSTVKDEEKNMAYIVELIKVYREKSSGKVYDLDSINESKFYKQHLYRQRLAFYSAQALKTFTRDELVDSESYEQVKEEVFQCVGYVIYDDYENSFKRLTETMKYVNTVPLEISPLGIIQPLEKCGVCHELVNDEKIFWQLEDE